MEERESFRAGISQEQFVKLPVYVQKELQRMAGRIDELEEKLKVYQGEEVSRFGYRTSLDAQRLQERAYVPTSSLEVYPWEVGEHPYWVGPDRRPYLDIFPDQGVVNIRATGDLQIVPAANNSIKLAIIRQF